MCFCKTRALKHIAGSFIPRASIDLLGNRRRSPVFLSQRSATNRNVRIPNSDPRPECDSIYLSQQRKNGEAEHKGDRS